MLVYRVLRLCKLRSIDFFNSIISSYSKFVQEIKQEIKFKSSINKKRRKKDAKLKESQKFNKRLTIISNSNTIARITLQFSKIEH
jgi:hypothetical protein